MIIKCFMRRKTRIREGKLPLHYSETCWQNLSRCWDSSVRSFSKEMLPCWIRKLRFHICLNILLVLPITPPAINNCRDRDMKWQRKSSLWRYFLCSLCWIIITMIIIQKQHKQKRADETSFVLIKASANEINTNWMRDDVIWNFFCSLWLFYYYCYLCLSIIAFH